MNNVFFDTNILFYAYDNSERDKQIKAQELVIEAIKIGAGHTSVQVIGEFFHATVIRKKVLTVDEAKIILKDLGGLYIMDIDYSLVRKAIENHRSFQTSYWDSLILATAQQAGCNVLYSEDLNSNQDYSGVTVKNPFAT